MGLKKPYVPKDYSKAPYPKLKCCCGKLLTDEDRCPLPQGKVCPRLN